MTDCDYYANIKRLIPILNITYILKYSSENSKMCPEKHSLTEFNSLKEVNSEYPSLFSSELCERNTETMYFHKTGKLIVFQMILELGRASKHGSKLQHFID